MSDYDLLLHHCPRDVTFLCERALVLMEDDNIASAVNDLLVGQCHCLVLLILIFR